MSRSVIVSAVRTPFGRLGGGLKGHAATELGAIAIRAALGRIELRGEEVDYVIMGQVLQAAAGQALLVRRRSARGFRSRCPPTR